MERPKAEKNIKLLFLNKNDDDDDDNDGKGKTGIASTRENVSFKDKEGGKEVFF